MKFVLLTTLVILMVSGNRNPVSGQNRPARNLDQSESKNPKDVWFNVPLRTLGGRQFWTDLVHFHGYRIQKNVMTGHHRLLDPKDTRKAWGGFTGCRKKLDKITAHKKLTPVTGHVVIIMHGLTRTRTAMNSLARYIDDNSDTTVINVSYASTRSSIDQHAVALASIIDNLPDAKRIDFVGHSMGSIVVRYYLGQYKPDGDPRFGRMVMLAPPNNGSRLARRLQDNLIFKSFWGVSGQDLSSRWEEIEKKLATPGFEFGIVAGSRPDKSALDNPLIGGEHDLVVTVQETRLPGARDFVELDLFHSTMMNDADVHRAAMTFIKEGCFSTEANRRPISADP